jgi:hypothetical protein
MFFLLIFAASKVKIMDWLHIVAVAALIVIGVVIYINKRNAG